jgi:hypothetical protein
VCLLSDREPEFVSKHKEALREAREACLKLARTVVEPGPRGTYSLQLAKANKALTGTCRQMFHWRGDDATWLKWGAIYGNADKTAQMLRMKNRWGEFAQLAELYVRGQKVIDDLATRPTGRGIEKFIDPGDISPWFGKPSRFVN